MNTRIKTQTKIATAAGAGKHDAPTEGFDGVYQRFQDAQEELMKFFKAPGWKRTMVAIVTTVLLASGIGFVAGEILSWLVVGAITMAVPAFLILLTYAIGLALACWYGGKFCGRVGGAILTGEADERAVAAYDATRKFMSRLNPFGARTVAAA